MRPRRGIRFLPLLLVAACGHAELAAPATRVSSGDLLRATQPAPSDPGCHVWRKALYILDGMRIDMGFEDTALEDILAFVRDWTGLSVVMLQDVRDEADIERRITFKVKNLPLKQMMKLLLWQYGLDYVVTEEAVVLIVPPSASSLEPFAATYDIRVLVGPEPADVHGGAGKVEIGRDARLGTLLLLPGNRPFHLGVNTVLDAVRTGVLLETGQEAGSHISAEGGALWVFGSAEVHVTIRLILGGLAEKLAKANAARVEAPRDEPPGAEKSAALAEDLLRLEHPRIGERTEAAERIAVRAVDAPAAVAQLLWCRLVEARASGHREVEARCGAILEGIPRILWLRR